MLKENKKVQYFLPLFWLLIAVNGLAVIFKSKLLQMGIDNGVVIIANLLLFLIGCLNVYLQLRAAAAKNPNAMTRGVMVATFLKLVVLGTAAFIYLKKTGAGRSANAIFVSMGLYIVYTWLEVRIGLRLNKKENAGN